MPQKRAYDCQVNFKAVGEEFARSFAAVSEPIQEPSFWGGVCEFLGEDPKKVQWFKSKRVLVGGARRLTPENASVAGGVHAGGQRP
jgi:hypothetical protein